MKTIHRQYTHRLRLAATALAVTLSLQDAHAQFAGGSGTSEDPYQIESAAQLDAVRTNLTLHFRQTADIDLGMAPWSESEGWVPVGTSANAPFSGTLDGASYTIRNLTVNRPSTTYQGLFGYLNGATEAPRRHGWTQMCART